ncbi:Dj-1 family protein [Lasiodiplodia theobromae]|uniref:Dj-1 family protein n=1 Tax=Lasiodiplodia theobromae TaxID=45133 RepID=UPI0015C3CE2A|nr:Dj-1 family protein [Lasiodiplodia theobromae]KAF4542458.1 Dj-1 family protein [Lasiodiplodia theobromae]
MLNSQGPVNFGVLLFPTFQALDVFGPLDALNILSLSHPINLALIAETLDPVNTAPISPSMNMFNSNFSESVLPTHTHDTAPPLDVLIVPGGLGTRAPVSRLQPTLSYLESVFPDLCYLITVCTGAGLAARTGILDGLSATTNKRAWHETTALGPAVKWVPRARWVRSDESGGKVWSSSGVSAGVDATLAWMAEVFGEAVADEVAAVMEWTRVRAWWDDPWAGHYNLTGQTKG